jgi:hypothetical protein
MDAVAARSPNVSQPLGTGRAIVYGGLVVGTLDITYALTYWGYRGVAPTRIFHSIAAGLLGRESSLAGGLPTAVLGGFLHYFIAFSIVTVYLLASRRLEILVRKPIPCGIVYGLGVYAFMNYVVIPLSAIGPPKAWFPPAPVLIGGLLIHMFGIGLPSALFARRAQEGTFLPR